MGDNSELTCADCVKTWPDCLVCERHARFPSCDCLPTCASKKFTHANQNVTARLPPSSRHFQDGLRWIQHRLNFEGNVHRAMAQRYASQHIPWSQQNTSAT